MSKKGSLEKRRPRLGDAKFVERLLGVRGGLRSRHLEAVTQRSESQRDRRRHRETKRLKRDRGRQREIVKSVRVH